MNCDKCGHELEIGEWPFCPHGFPIKGLTVIDDSIPGGMTIENLGPVPETFYSHSDHKRRMRELGVEPKVRHRGSEGSDKSKFTQRWI